MPKQLKIGRYVVKDTIGEGLFGKVKLAINEQTQKEYAMKILNKNDILSNHLADNIRNEIAIMKQLHHPNINGLCEVLSSFHNVYVVMDLVRGNELLQIVQDKGILDEKVARSYFKQLVMGVAYCHGKGVCHRDLKPENVLVNFNGTLKITDFGVSAMLKKNRRGEEGEMDEGSGNVGNHLLYTQCGTLQYSAPEMMKSDSKGYSGYKVDTWSCGIILYIMLAGMSPFETDESDPNCMSTLYQNIQSCRVDYPLWISDDAKDLLQHLLVSDPEKRFSIDEVKNHYWVKGISRKDAIVMSSISTASAGSKSASSSDHSIGDEKNSEIPPFPKAPSALKGISQSPKDIREYSSQISSGLSINLETPKTPNTPRTPRTPVTPRTPPRQPQSQRSRKKKNTNRRGRTRARLKQLEMLFPDGDIYDLISTILPKKQQSRVNDAIDKLENAGIDCVEDLLFLAKRLGSSDAVVEWLAEKTELSEICSMRIGSFLFIEE